MTTIPRPAGAAASLASEWELKAALFYNMAQFVEWPPSSFSDTNSPLIIGVLGQDPFGKTLDDVVRGEKVAGRPITIQRFRSIRDVRSCHILYLSSTDSFEVTSAIRQLGRRPILTVGESDTFARRAGGMIQFFTSSEGKIRLRINITKVTEASLKISSKLLRVAEVVRSDD